MVCVHPFRRVGGQWMAWILGSILLHACISVEAQTFRAAITSLEVTNYTGFIVDSVPSMRGIAVDANHTFTTTSLTVARRFYAASFQMVDDSGAVVPILNDSGVASTNTLVVMAVSLPVDGIEKSTDIEEGATLVPAHPLDPSRRYAVQETLLTAPALGRPWTSTGISKTTPLKPYLQISDTTENPPKTRVTGTLSTLQSLRPYSIRTVPGLEPFVWRVALTAYRFDHLSSPATTNLLTVEFPLVLRDLTTGLAVPLKTQATKSVWTLPIASHQPGLISPASATLTADVEVHIADGVQLDSVNHTYRIELNPILREDTGSIFTLDSMLGDAQQLLHYNGHLLFGSLDGVVHQLSTDPIINAQHPPDYVETTLVLPVNGGTMTANPAQTFGGNGPLTIQLRTDGTGVVAGGVTSIDTPPGQFEEIAGIRFRKKFATLSPLGAFAGVVYAYLPSGFAYSYSSEHRAQIPYLLFTNVPLNSALAPAASVLRMNAGVFGGTPFFFSEESKPLLLTATAVDWHISEGEIVVPQPLQTLFVRGEDDQALESLRGFVDNPSAVDHKSNDGFYSTAQLATGSTLTVRPDALGAALVSMSLNLTPGVFYPSHPYFDITLGGPLVVAGGFLVSSNGAFDLSASHLELGTQIPVTFDPNCPDGNCGGTDTAPQTLLFTADAGHMHFTRDGGLAASGSISPQVLDWAHLSGDNFAQQTSEGTNGIFVIPGTRLRRDQSDQPAARRPMVLLLTGVGGETITDDVERPGAAVYPEGLGNYAGLNFRAHSGGPSLGRSWVAGNQTD